MAGPRAQSVKIGAAVAVALLGFALSFGLARATDDGGKAEGTTQAEQGSVAVLPPEAARLVRLSPAGAVPALRAAPTVVVRTQPAPSTRATPAPQPEPTAAPTPAPEPEPTPAPAPEPEPTIPPATTYIP